MLSVWKASKYKGGHEYFVDSMEPGHNLEHAVSFIFPFFVFTFKSYFRTFSEFILFKGKFNSFIFN